MSNKNKYNIIGKNNTIYFRYYVNRFEPRYKSMGEYIYPIYKLVRIVSGTADWSFRGMVYHVAAGDILILRNNVIRVIERIDPPDDLICDMYEFIPAFLEENINCLKLFDRDDKNKDVLFYNPDVSRPVILLLDKIRDEAMKPDGFSCEIIRAHLINTLVLINRIWGKVFFNDANGNSEYIKTTNDNNAFLFDDCNESMQKSNDTAFTMMKIANIIRNNITNDLKIEDLAASVYMSSSSFAKLFHKYNGVSVSEFIIRQRIVNTLQILRLEKCNVIEAAYRSGFTSASGFYKTFKRIMGITPIEYLKKI